MNKLKSRCIRDWNKSIIEARLAARLVWGMKFEDMSAFCQREVEDKLTCENTTLTLINQTDKSLRILLLFMIPHPCLEC